MKVTKKSYNVSVTASKDFQSIKLTEGFEVEVNDDFDELQYEDMKTKLQDRLLSQVHGDMKKYVSERKLDDGFDL